MSKIILGWQLSNQLSRDNIEHLCNDIVNRYQPLFTDKINYTYTYNQNQALLHFDITNKSDPNICSDKDKLICLTGKPTIIADKSGDIQIEKLSALSFFRNIFELPNKVNYKLIHAINPPFTLAWLDKSNNQLCLIHDGLGYDQFFISETSEGVVFSNKCWPIKRLLNKSFQVNCEGWKYYFVMGWFPENETPFENIRVLGRGEVIECDGKNHSLSKEDTFHEWISKPKSGSKSQLLERSARSFEKIIEANVPQVGHYRSDLTGGIDSRCFCSFLIKHRIPCWYYTNKSHHFYDTIIARKIAKKYDLKWICPDPDGEFPSIELITEQFKKMLLWGEGLADANRFVHFSLKPQRQKVSPYLVGLFDDISKLPHNKRITKYYEVRNFDKFLTHTLNYYHGIMSEILPSHDASKLTNKVKHQILQGKIYDVSDFDLIEYFYINENVRRWESAHYAINLFDSTIVAPFLFIDHMKLSFLLDIRERSSCVFQRYIIERNVKELLSMPINEELYKNWYYRFKGYITKNAIFRKLHNEYTWQDHFRKNGKALVGAAFVDDTPLWRIIDKNKAKRKFNNFLRGKDRNLSFFQKIIAFHQWHKMYF